MKDVDKIFKFGDERPLFGHVVVKEAQPFTETPLERADIARKTRAKIVHADGISATKGVMFQQMRADEAGAASYKKSPFATRY